MRKIVTILFALTLVIAIAGTSLAQTAEPVSYTHLTLPTSDLV